MPLSNGQIIDLVTVLDDWELTFEFQFTSAATQEWNNIVEVGDTDARRPAVFMYNQEILELTHVVPGSNTANAFYPYGLSSSDNSVNFQINTVYVIRAYKIGNTMSLSVNGDLCSTCSITVDSTRMPFGDTTIVTASNSGSNFNQGQIRRYSYGQTCHREGYSVDLTSVEIDWRHTHITIVPWTQRDWRACSAACKSNDPSYPYYTYDTRYSDTPRCRCFNDWVPQVQDSNTGATSGVSCLYPPTS